ncbi:MAG: S8 family serine peptidase [Microscillaceae bacterium]|nr:S8 family serine peptidase [Microscillaceae bacterium]
MQSLSRFFFLLLLMGPLCVQAQKAEDLLLWFHADEKTEQYRGVSTRQAYELLKGRASQTVIVGVIDSGIEIDHPDLEGRIWVNEDEIPGNGIDDDNNGYVDDVNGWDFIGGANGEDVDKDTYELTRLYKIYSEKYAALEGKKIPKKQKAEFNYYQKIKADYEGKVAETKAMAEEVDNAKQLIAMVQQADGTLRGFLKKDIYTLEELEGIKTENADVNMSKGLITEICKSNGIGVDKLLEEIASYDEYVKYLNGQLEYGLNPKFDPRPTVGDDYGNLTERGYGNGEVEGPDAEHGTHVAGIIAARRDNDLGGMGIAENVRIMVIRAVPDGDERDKDVANAIRYAVDNGAQIINMSFGKSYSPQKTVVDEAVRYAEQKGVLLVHAAGNDAKNIDVEPNFPTVVYENGQRASNWIEVGASSYGEDDNFVGDFSNFGQKNVDIFAPGVEIYAPVTDYKFKYNQGTSMAAPVVAGVAALLKSYFPQLSPVEIKQILMDSARKYAGRMISKPGGEGTVDFAKLSVSGGIVNAYEAVRMALEKEKP